MTKIKCLINLRPMWKRYFTGSEHILKFDQIEYELYKNLGIIIKTHSNVDFYFVPFNTDTFGMSDIDAAHRLKNIVGDVHNFFITYEERHCNSMVKYLNKFDIAICMRLHACVFCWASGMPVLGIEYADAPGKVADFFKQHMAGSCVLVSEVNVDCMSDFINENTANT